MLTAKTVSEAVRPRARGSGPLRVFWAAVSGDRDAFAEELRELLEGEAVIPVVLRTGGFVDPNAVMKDVADVLELARGEIRKMKDVANEHRGVDLVLISRKDLSLADTSSPIVLPDWFPVAPDRTVTVSITDLTWSAEVPVSDSSLALDDLRRILYDLDKALVARLQESQNIDRRLSQALWDLIGLKGGELKRIEDFLDGVRNPVGYRPSASKNPTVVSRIWAHANSTSPDRLPRTARALTQALRPDRVSAGGMSLTAVLNRPTNPIDAAERWSFCLIVTVRSACQLITAAAHADDYPRFPQALLKSTSLDVRRFLDAAVTTLEQGGARDD